MALPRHNGNAQKVEGADHPGWRAAHAPGRIASETAKARMPGQTGNPETAGNVNTDANSGQSPATAQPIDSDAATEPSAIGVTDEPAKVTPSVTMSADQGADTTETADGSSAATVGVAEEDAIVAVDAPDIDAPAEGAEALANGAGIDIDTPVDEADPTPEAVSFASVSPASIQPVPGMNGSPASQSASAGYNTQAPQAAPQGRMPMTEAAGFDDIDLAGNTIDKRGQKGIDRTGDAFAQNGKSTASATSTAQNKAASPAATPSPQAAQQASQQAPAAASSPAASAVPAQPMADPLAP